ncbi:MULTISPECIES: entericidin A/B family lipoprotein [unclassified Ensifer]|uniref:entericidin domain-containing protein n=1 Tax=unclassified Ensifer TaxID=2633371 RepID=UPI0008134E57|nr:MULTISPECIES: entericidin A/B family lipoprotein [unclassified Ensifer]OCO98992.1 entericidin [Ensifer sp. LC14]OCP11386.1 entericidin [Ensifer sp. LC13]OCP11970.1 entericidin [Ensifer sp. LC11]OCP33480.1 entericidin [Ensifer sp. LC499]
MTVKTLAIVGAVLVALSTLSACGNTIRGIGRDTASAVNATQDAGRSVAKAAN